MHELTQDLQHYASRVRILHEMAECIASQIQADGFTLYLVTQNATVSTNVVYVYWFDTKHQQCFNDKCTLT